VVTRAVVLGSALVVGVASCDVIAGLGTYQLAPHDASTADGPREGAIDGEADVDVEPDVEPDHAGDGAAADAPDAVGEAAPVDAAGP
jgi:hypothetical protein